MTRYVPEPVRNLLKSTTSQGNAGAFVPGQGGASQWFNLPSIALMIAAALMYREMSKTASEKAPGKKMGCDEKYCPPGAYQTHVDRPLNTLLKDQSCGAGLKLPQQMVTLATPYMKTKSDYYREAAESPGVKLVAHAVI